MLKSLISKGLTVPHRCENHYILIVYLILQLRQIPQIYGDTLLNKLRYVNLILSQEGNLISLSERLFSSACM
jgi:hypothetical protein